MKFLKPVWAKSRGAHFRADVPTSNVAQAVECWAAIWTARGLPPLFVVNAGQGNRITKGVTRGDSLVQTRTEVSKAMSGFTPRKAAAIEKASKIAIELLSRTQSKCAASARWFFDTRWGSVRSSSAAWRRLATHWLAIFFFLAVLSLTAGAAIKAEPIPDLRPPRRPLASFVLCRQPLRKRRTSCGFSASTCPQHCRCHPDRRPRSCMPFLPTARGGARSIPPVSSGCSTPWSWQNLPRQSVRRPLRH
jgi:hypothetical protein